LEQGPHPQDRAHGRAADPDVSTRTAALLSGRVDWIESPAPDSLEKLKAGGCKIETNAIPHMWPYTLSIGAGAPTADIRVRKALNSRSTATPW